MNPDTFRFVHQMDLLHKVRILLIRRSSGNCTGIIKKIASGQDMMILPEDSSIYFPLHPLKFLFAFLQSCRFLIL